MYIMHHNLFLGRFLRNHVGFNLTLLQNISTEHDKIKRLAEEIINQKQPPVKHTKTNVDQDIAKEIATKIINIYGNVSEVPDNVTNSGVANRQKGVYTEEKALLKHIFDSYNSIASDSKGTDSDKPNTDKKDDSDEVNEMPEAPTSCCMSGCPNCVWLDYAEKLSRYFRDGGENAIKEINKRITDENIKAFVLHELRMRKLKKY